MSPPLLVPIAADPKPSTHLLARCSAKDSPRGFDAQNKQHDRFYSSAQWTADGTCLLVASSKQDVSTFVLPADLLDNRDQPRDLKPEAVVQLPEPTQAIVPAPYFSLAEPSTQVFLTACRDHPLQIRQTQPPKPDSPPLAIYKLIKAETEAYIAPTALLWEYPGTHFICGSMNRIDYFDVNRAGSEGPFLTVPTVPSKSAKSKGYNVGMKGHISALASTRPDEHGCSVVAAGTRTRWIGMYDIHRTDKTIANWAIAGTDGLSPEMETGGRGIMQLVWSPCGRYLIVNERSANGILVYDIRGSGKLLSVLNGRPLSTQQRLSCDVFTGDPYANGTFEVWAGTQDGTVVVWDEVGKDEGIIQPSWSWEGHGSPVGSTALHSSGSVVATCSGGWDHSSISDGEAMPGTTVLEESSLKLWAIS
ncbi:WD40 repeat-like-containing domain protein [Sarocladium implicatum]|nr:WD40 repeat-like-containing domain protein [Sarocladium implicatum]